MSNIRTEYTTVATPVLPEPTPLEIVRDIFMVLLFVAVFVGVLI
jgi:hypothetical protein